MKDRINWYRKMGIDLTPDSVLVDIGAGDGRCSIDFAPQVGQVIAVDANGTVPPPDELPGNVTWLPGQFPGVESIETNSVDFVFVNNVLEHVAPNKVDGLINGCCEILKPGGGAWFSWASLWSNVGSHTGGRLKGWEHLDLWRQPEKWQALLASRFGEEYAENWMQHEWRPGLLRHEWLKIQEPSTCLRDVAKAIGKRFEILKHNMVCDDDGRLWRSPQAAWVMWQAPSYHDLVCTSDTWLVRKPLHQ